MNASRIFRSLVTLAALFFLFIGLGFWFAPEQMAHQFGIEAIRLTGVSALRADLGGLFVGLGLLCGAGAWTNRRRWLVAAALFLVAIVIGRSIGWIVDGRSGVSTPELVIELVVLFLLIGSIRSSKSPDGADAEHRSASLLRGRWKWVAGSLGVVVLPGAAAILFSPGVQQWLFDGAAQKMSATTNMAPLADD